jgi:hypothetical protein
MLPEVQHELKPMLLVLQLLMNGLCMSNPERI